MKKLLTALALMVGLTAISLPAFAENDRALKQPVRMTDQQLDEITAGALVEITANVSDISARFVDIELEIEVDVTVISVDVWDGGKRHHGFKPKFHDSKRGHKFSRT